MVADNEFIKEAIKEFLRENFSSGVRVEGQGIAEDYLRLLLSESEIKVHSFDESPSSVPILSSATKTDILLGSVTREILMCAAVPLGDIYYSDVVRMAGGTPTEKEVVVDEVLREVERGTKASEISSRTGAPEDVVRSVTAKVKESADLRRPPKVPKLSFRTVWTDWRE